MVRHAKDYVPTSGIRQTVVRYSVNDPEFAAIEMLRSLTPGYALNKVMRAALVVGCKQILDQLTESGQLQKLKDASQTNMTDAMASLVMDGSVASMLMGLQPQSVSQLLMSSQSMAPVMAPTATQLVPAANVQPAVSMPSAAQTMTQVAVQPVSAPVLATAPAVDEMVALTVVPVAMGIEPTPEGQVTTLAMPGEAIEKVQVKAPAKFSSKAKSHFDSY